MKLTTFLILISIMQVSATSFAQKISLSEKNTPIAKVFKKITAQSGYAFFVSGETLKGAKPVTISVKNMELSEVLAQIFKDQPVSFALEDNIVVVSKKAEPTFIEKVMARFQAINVRGKVVDSAGNALPGASVKVKGKNQSTTTNANGEFGLIGVDETATLLISYVGYQVKEVQAKADLGAITLISNTTDLQEVTVNKGYYTEKKRLSTGNVSKVTAAEIGNQPVNNPLIALEGKIPGLLVNQTSGNSGATVRLQLRGRNSITNNSDPLYIIDGMPFGPNNGIINSFTNIASQGTEGKGSLSAFSSINPQDIESIEVLKDADATAIYGSRGANGVILITTKRGKTDKTTFDVNLNSGFSEVNKMQPYLNTQQYLAFRKEAYNNANLIPSESDGQDLVVYDQDKYTNFQKLLIGGRAKTTDLQLTLAGGSGNTQFRISGGFRHDGTVYPTEKKNERASFSSRLNHVSTDGKFFSNLAFNYSLNDNGLFVGTLDGISLPPNTPDLKNSDGSLNWSYKGVGFVNPLAQFLKNYQLKTDNYLINFDSGYSFTKDITFKTSLGYNGYYTDEKTQNPISSLDPNSGATTGSAGFSNQNYKGMIVEPQLDYKKMFGKHKISTLVGGSWQYQYQIANTIRTSGYTNDALLGSINSGASPNVNSRDNVSSKYKYAAVFARLNYNFDDRLIINLSGRRDGSSRFGPDQRFSNFGSIAGAYIFSDDLIKNDLLPFLSFGKIRASYGITGSDQIGNYRYLSTYSPVTSYQSMTSINPTALNNPDYRWEKNKKFETSLELGFLKDRISLNVTYFDNRSGNQLVSYTLPQQTGFENILQNLDAIIANNGYEFELSSIIIKNNKFQWTTSFNISFIKNELVAFPGLETSPYKTTYVVGKSTNLIYKAKYQGIDPNTGEMLVEDINGDGEADYKDAQYLGNLDPRYFGGISTTLSYKNFSLYAFAEFKKQIGKNYYFTTSTSSQYPGIMFNPSTLFLDRWHKIGDQALAPRINADYPLPTIIAYQNSNIGYSDASYLRLKNVSLSYDFSGSLLKKWKINSLRFYLQGQNLLTITHYKGADPEVQYAYQLPLLRTLTAGLQIKL